MTLEGAAWTPLTAERMESIPEASGVFEIANLVRSIVFVGQGHGNVRAAVNALTQIPGRLPSSAGGLYVRWLVTDREAELCAERLRAFSAAHGGTIPIANRHEPKPVAAARAQQAAA